VDISFMLVVLMINTTTPKEWATKQLWNSPPKWKIPILERMEKGKYEPVKARFTRYSDLDSLDGVTGGGNTCWWGETTRLRWGLMAASTYWPRGTVFYSSQLKMLLVVADRGPAVTSKSHFDIYCSSREEWDLCDRVLSKGVLYKVGFVSRKDYCSGR